MSGSTGSDESPRGEEPETDPAAVEDRRHALERAAELIRSGNLEVISPEELAELRRPKDAD